MSELFSLISISLKASSPTRYLNFGGFSDVTAFKMTFATSIAEEPFSNLGLNPETLFCVISAYGELGLLDTLFPILNYCQN